MQDINLANFAKNISSRVITNNSDYMTQHISEIINNLVRESGINVDLDTCKLVCYAATAATAVAIEVSTAATVTVLAELGLVEHDEHPHLHIVKSPDD